LYIYIIGREREGRLREKEREILLNDNRCRAEDTVPVMPAAVLDHVVWMN
jgi:hypothetical protein